MEVVPTSVLLCTMAPWSSGFNGHKIANMLSLLFFSLVACLKPKVAVPSQCGSVVRGWVIYRVSLSVEETATHFELVKGGNAFLTAASIAGNSSVGSSSSSFVCGS